MATYDYHSATFHRTTAQDNVGTLILPGNKRRVSLVITSNAQNGVTLTQSVSLGLSTLSTSTFWFTSPPVNGVLTYRDYGPLLREALYLITNTTAAMDVYIIETFQVGK